METNIGFKHNNHSALWGGRESRRAVHPCPHPPALWGAQQCVTCVSGLQLPSQAEPALHLHAAPLLCMAPFPVLDSGLCVWNTDPPFYVSHSTLTSQPLPSPSGWGMLRNTQCCSRMNCPVNLMSTSTWPTLGEQRPTFSKLVQRLPSASRVPPAHPTQRASAVLIPQARVQGGELAKIMQLSNRDAGFHGAHASLILKTMSYICTLCSKGEMPAWCEWASLCL